MTYMTRHRLICAVEYVVFGFLFLVFAIGFTAVAAKIISKLCGC